MQVRSRILLDRNLPIATALILTANFALLGCTPAWSAETTNMVPMSDGAKLVTDVLLPDKSDGPWPVVLERTPYNHKNALVKQFKLAERGYAVVAQNIRGTGGSEGNWTVFGNDGWGGPGFRDGADTVAWIRQQSWCSGKIGVVGFSASGIAAQLLVGAAPEGLACAYVNAASDNLYETFYQNGCYRTNTADTWPEAGPTRAEIARHPMYDDFWRARNAREQCAKSNVPVFVSGGWFDLFERNTTAFFSSQNMNWQPFSDGKCKMTIVPLAHAAPPGELQFPDRGPTNLDAAVGTMNEWLDYWLKGQQNGIYDKHAVGVFLMTDKDAKNSDGNHVVTFERWPPRKTSAKLYFHADKGMSLKDPSETDSKTAYRYNPANPTPSNAGNNLYPPSGPHDQQSIESRDDVIEFTTRPLTGDVTVIGPITVKLFASTDALDTDFVARLCDVYPDGRSELFCEGIVRARFREDTSHETFPAPNSIYEYTIDLWDTALTFAPGHRIRVDIASASVPRYDPNPNSGEPIKQGTHTAIANNTIYLNRKHASHLILPLMNWRQREFIPE